MEYVPLVEHYDGTAWKVQPSPPAAEFPESGLTAISCPSSTECWAAGEGQDFNREPSTGGLLVSHFDGTTWSRAEVPSVERGAQGGNSNLLDCPSVDRCILLTNFDVAQGEYLTEGGAIFDGRTWRNLPVPGGVLFQALSCSGAHTCYAIGGENFYGPESAYQFDGKAWRSLGELPTGAPEEEGGWVALECRVSAQCITGGGGDVEVPTGPAAIASLHGGGWKLQALPDVSGGVTDISCATTTSCVAVGGEAVGSTAPRSKPLAFRLGP